MSDRLTPPRMLLALLMLVAAVAISTQFALPAQKFVILLAGCVLALVPILAGEGRRRGEALASEELRQKRLRAEGRTLAYQDIINGISDPILLVRNAKVAYANPAALKLLGAHVSGQDVRIAIRHPEAANRLAAAERDETGEPILMIGIGTGDQRWEMRIGYLADGLKLVHLSDKSSRHAADRMRTDFVANASHELRTPLAAIKGFIETLQDPDAGNDRDTRARFLKIMFDEADRMQRLVEDLMSLSRIEADKYRVPDGKVDLAELANEEKRLFTANRGKVAPQIMINIADEIPAVRADRSQISQLLHNLISNAVKYGHKGTPVTIRAQLNRSGTMVRLSVADVGDGIAPEDLPRLTERFYRVDKGRSRSVGGTGLGLAIVKHIVERHGGRLHFASELGKGTVVTVNLPIYDQ